MGNNRDWLATHVDSITKNKPLTTEAREMALDIAEEAFHGRTGVGDAAEIGVRAVERTIYRKTR
jgi:hypothetical protein